MNNYIEISYDTISQYQELYQDLIKYVNSWTRYYDRTIEPITKIDRIDFKIKLDEGNRLCAQIYTNSGACRTQAEYEGRDGYGIPVSFYNRLLSVHRGMQLDKII